MRKWAGHAAAVFGLAVCGAGVYFVVVYLLVCEFAKSVE